MLCEQCGKKQASVHVTKIQNGQKIERHLCKECAQQSSEFSTGIDFQNMLSSFFEYPQTWGQKARPKQGCPVCGSTLTDIQNRSQLGCSQCYTTFDSEVNTLLRRIHGTTEHVGKIPESSHGRIRLERQVQDLREQLQQAIAEEQYEKAAELRDQIRSLEGQLDGKEG